MESTFFDLQLVRLKKALHVVEDQEAAGVLGMTKAAFSARKKRNAFPETELRALVQQRPELGINVDYVLTGQLPVPFKPAWLRLKGALGMHKEEDAAAWLGMDFAAVNAHAQRDEFPVQQFLAACALRPQLVDKDHVLTGVPQAAKEMIDAVRKGTPFEKVAKDEKAMLDVWRRCTPSDQSLILQMMERLALHFPPEMQAAVKAASGAGHATGKKRAA